MHVKLDEQKYKNFFAHTCKDKPKETLIEHCNLTKFYLEKIICEKNLSILLDKLFSTLDDKYSSLIKELFFNAIFLHDLGKINESFQAVKMENKLFSETSKTTNHSEFSVEEFLKIYRNKIDEIEDDESFEKINYILNTFAYSIAKHHGKLDSIEDFMCEDGTYELVKKDIDTYIKEPFEFYILNKLLFSLLISSDYYATTQYMADLPIKDFGLIKKKEKIINKFEEYKIIKNIRKNEDIKGINILRSQMFLEAEKNLAKHQDKNIFYLEAPTGSGKTLSSINLAMNLLKEKEINKIFYIFPFNTLVEQTKKQLDDIFDDVLDIEVINSISPIKQKNDEDQEKEESKYQESYMGRLFFHNELILTTHIAFFDILFGTSKEDNFPLWQFANSVIILDEIQSYDNKLWSYMTRFLSSYAKVLNMKIIIMSATLPKLDKLIENNNDIFVELIENKDKYFQSEYFKNRVELDFSLLKKEELEYDDLIEELKKQKENYSKILFEFIKKDSAREFFEVIKDDESFAKFEIYELSGDDNKATRQKIIDKIKNEENLKIILIATQVIEAGVDIDMDLGFKDISTIDSEEQFLGRINRSCKKINLKHKPKVYFFNKDEANNIYKGDFRIEDNLKKDEFQEVLKTKDFKRFYENVFTRIKKSDKNIKQGTLENFEEFEEFVKKLHYKKIQEYMKLIKTQNFRLYFPFKLDISKYDIEEFKNLDEKFISDGKLDGLKVWQEFENLNKIEGYAKKEVQRSKLNSLMQFFTFNILKFSEKQTLPYYDYICGSYYLVSDYEEFIDEENCKFNRKAYQEKSGDIFW